MYISLSTIALVIIAIFLINIWQKGSSSHAVALSNKNMLIKEAERVIASMEKLSWTEMTDGQREVHDCAIERLRLLKSYKKNHAPDHYPFMREWPTWFNPNRIT